MRFGARHLVEILLVASVAVAAVAGAQVKGFRWIDDEGNVHYAARRDQVPERYREQLGPPKPGEPARPQLSPNATGRAGVPRGCILRVRGAQGQRGSSHSYQSCDACREALHALGENDAKRAECFASSIEDELGKRGR